MSKTTASLVIYKNNVSELEPLLYTLSQDDAITRWIVIDNGASEDPRSAERLRILVEGFGGKYQPTAHNLGFGAGHNIALIALKDFPSDFHLILNPDIAFDRGALPKLVEVMETHPRVGLIMPRVLYPDGKTQHLCKLLPTPLDFALRRFAPGPLQRLLRGRMGRYELCAMDPTKPAEIPFLSGCFMFTRRSVLESVGGFDESYFLYMEDVDLCRCFSMSSKLLYWPAVSVTHVHQRGSHRSMRLTFTHIRSTIIYFNKWGWLFDAVRSTVNRNTLDRLTKHDSALTE